MLDVYGFSTLHEGIVVLAACVFIVCMTGFLFGWHRFLTIQFGVYCILTMLVWGGVWVYSLYSGGVDAGVLAAALAVTFLVCFFVGNPIVSFLGRKLDHKGGDGFLILYIQLF